MIKKYLCFCGKASRIEFLLSCLIAYASIFIFFEIINTLLPIDLRLYAFAALCIVISYILLAVTVRRLHDTNRSGYWLIVLIIVLWTWLLNPLSISYEALVALKLIGIITTIVFAYILFYEKRPRN